MTTKNAEELTLNLPVLIQNNLRDAILCMMRQGGYAMNQFGKVCVAYSDTPGPDYNMIFNYTPDEPALVDLEQALNYAAKQRYPFLLVHDQEPFLSLQNLLDKFAYKWGGFVTKMALDHNGFVFADDEDVIIRQVATDKELKLYCDVIDEAFGRQPNSTLDFMQPMNLLKNASELKLYMGFVKHEANPVATTMLYLPPDKDALVGHYAWAVRQQHRKQGIMTKLVQKTVTIAKQNGYGYSVAQCFAASAHLAQRIGFKSYGDLYLYANQK